MHNLMGKGVHKFLPNMAWRESLLAPERHDIYLDWMRGLAAMAVFVSHLRGGFFVKWADLDSSSQNLTNFILFSLTRLGRESVVVFFVLSGYLVGGNALHRAMDGDFSVRRYAIARIARLYPVLVPALFLTAFFDSLHIQASTVSLGVRPFFVNLFFLNGILGPSFGSNAPLWSLAYEWWYYVAFGAGLFAAMSIRARKKIAVASSVVVLCTALFIMSGPMFALFPLWLLGALARATPRRPSVSLAALATFTLLIAIAVSTSLWNLFGDYLVGFATFGFICAIKNQPPLEAQWSRVGTTLAAFSYTLYAVHYPINYFTEELLHPNRLRHAGIAQWTSLVIIGAGIILICYGWYWLFERQSPRFRRWLEARV